MPVSPVRMRTTCSRSYTKILPSPILPVRAAPSMASITRSTRLSSMAAFNLYLGQEIHNVFSAAVELSVSLLTAESLDFCDRYALHADGREGFSHLVKA